MRHVGSFIAFIFALTLSATALTADTPEQNKASGDPLLAQRVTLDATDTRLHAVLQKLSAMTGVSIKAGKNEKDWPVRDIPVIVCARDVPLGSLLRGIADTTHLVFSRQVLDGKNYYRILRDAKRDRDIIEYFDKLYAAGVAGASWDWDVLSQLKDIPESDFDFRSNSHGQPQASNDKIERMLRRPETKILSQLASAVGPEVKERALTGNGVTVEYASSTPQVQAIILELGRSAYQEIYGARALRNQRVPNPPTAENHGNLHVRFYLKGANEPRLHFMVNGENCNKDYVIGWYSRIAEFAKGRRIADRPRRPRLPGQEDLTFSTGAGVSGGVSGDTKITLDIPADNRDPSYYDVLVALSKATGYTIICEDFMQSRNLKPYSSILGKEMEIRAILATVPTVTWKIDEAKRMITGQADNWPYRHNNLVPEETINFFKAKLDGPGVQIDDLGPLLSLNEEQCDEWLRRNPNMAGFTPGRRRPAPGSIDRLLWSLYYSLDKADRAMAKSETGLSLSKFDAMWLYDEFLSENSLVRNRVSLPLEPGETSASQRRPDAEIIASLSLHLRAYPDHGVRPINGRTRQSYSLCLRGQRNGREMDIPCVMSVPVPMYSPEREAEIAGPKASN